MIFSANPGRILAAFSLLAVLGCGADSGSQNRWSSVPPGESRDLGVVTDFSQIAENPKPEGHSPPFHRQDGRKFRIALVVSGSYWEFYDSFKALLDAFSILGWAKNLEVPPGVATTEGLIRLLDQTEYSPYLEFPPDLYFDLKWGENLGPLKNTLIRKGAGSGADLVVALGGIAGNAFSSLDMYPLPVVMDAITDPLAAGVIKSYDDSGKDFITCRVDPDQFKRQVRLFHETVGFETLGIIYGNDDYGKIYGAVRDVDEVARERGFQVIRRDDVPEVVAESTPRLYLQALEEICRSADAVYVGAATAVTEYNILPEMVEILNRYRKPSFALEGSIRVRQGLLFGLSQAGLVHTGVYNARKILKIFEGAKPRDLPQLFENTPSIAVNQATARAIGYDLSLDILAGADEIYGEVQP